MYGGSRKVLEGMALDWELIFSVDPCTDRTEELILRAARARPAREDAAFLAPLRAADGDDCRLEAASGDAVVVIDCDLQDPPELIPELVARWREGYDVVYAQRRTRAGETLSKRVVAAVGYRVIGASPRSRFPRTPVISV